MNEIIEYLKVGLAIASPIFACGVCYAILKITEKGMERFNIQFTEYKDKTVPDKIGDVYAYINDKDKDVNRKIDKVAEDVAYIRGKMNGLLK